MKSLVSDHSQLYWVLVLTNEGERRLLGVVDIFTFWTDGEKGMGLRDGPQGGVRVFQYLNGVAIALMPVKCKAM